MLKISFHPQHPIGTKEVPTTEYCTPIENQQKALILMVFSFDRGNKEVPSNFYITIPSQQFLSIVVFMNQNRTKQPKGHDPSLLSQGTF